MPFNGSGTFLRIRNWVNDAAANIRIRADRHDSEDDNFASGLSQCITKDGQTTVTANLPMANYRHTGVGAATAATHYARYDQVQIGNAVWADAGGTADAITATYNPNTITPVDGQLYYVRAGAANATTTPTFSPDGETARTIVKNGNVALAAGDIAGDGHELILRYRLSNTKYELLNPAVAGAATLSGNNAFTGNNTFAGTSGFSGIVTMTGDPINEAQGTAIASATTTDIGAASGNFVHITGTTTITGLGTIQAGTRRIVTFDGILTLTHNGTSLILPTAANITTAAGDSAIFVSEGSGNWRCVSYTRVNGASLDTVKYLILEDQKTSGTNGGTATSGSWFTRTLNTEVVDEIGSTLSSSEFTLPAGKYRITAEAPAFNVAGHQCRLYNVTNATVDLTGTSAYNMNPSNMPTNTTNIDGIITITATKTFRLEHRVGVTSATQGLGYAAGFGTEVYSRVVVEKLA